MKATSRLGAALGALLILVSSNAEAREPSKAEIAEAQRRFQEATDLYEQENNLEGALAEFRRAYALAPNFRVLYNIGQLCYLLQDYPCAFNSFNRYLREGGAEVPNQRRDDVQKDLGRLQSRVGRLRVLTNRPGAEVYVDNIRVGRSPLEGPVLVSAGRPQVRVTLRGHQPVTRVVEVASQETATVELELVPVDGAEGMAALPQDRSNEVGVTTAPVPRSYASAPTPKLPWIITGTLAVAAGATGGVALWSASDLKKTRNQFGVSEKNELDSKSTRTKRLALTTDVLLGATVVSAAVAAFMTFTADAPSANDFALTVGPGGVGLSGAF